MDDRSLLILILIVTSFIFLLSVFGRWIYWRGIDRGIEICKETEKKMRERMSGWK